MKNLFSVRLFVVIFCLNIALSSLVSGSGNVAAELKAFIDKIKDELSTSKLTEQEKAGVLIEKTKLWMVEQASVAKEESESLLYSCFNEKLPGIDRPFPRKMILTSENIFLSFVIVGIPKLAVDVIGYGLFNEFADRWYKKIYNMLYISPLVISSTITKNLSFDRLILDADIKQRLLMTVQAFDNIVKNYGRASFNGLLFYGLPGTGKTEAARVLASMVAKNNPNLVFLELSGDVLARASREDLKNFIDTLNLSSKPTIVLIDECEKFLLDRRLVANKGEKSSEGLAEWLTFTSKPNPRIQFIYTTNYRAKIEKAMLRRVQLLEFKLPSLDARIELLNTYFTKVFLKDFAYPSADRKLMQDIFTTEYFYEIASKLTYTDHITCSKLDFFSPANIENIMNDAKNFSIASDELGILTKNILEKVVDQAIASKKEEIDSERKNFEKQSKI